MLTSQTCICPKGTRTVFLKPAGPSPEDSGVVSFHLEQVSISLKNAGLLKAVPGKNGGHLLARAADRIRLGDIVEATIGEVNMVECMLEPEICMKAETCECRNLYCLINKRITNALNEFTLLDLEQDRINFS